MKRRTAIAVAWVIAPATFEEPFSVQLDQSDPVLVPDTRLTADPRHVASRADLLNDVAEQAYLRLQEGSVFEAVGMASGIASESEATADTVYNLACIYSIASVRVNDDASQTEEQRKELQEQYAAGAVNLLRQAIAKGFNDVEHIQRDSDLKPLQERTDFQSLLKELTVLARPSL